MTAYDWAAWFLLIFTAASVLFFDYYTFRVLRKADKQIDKADSTQNTIQERISGIESTIQQTVVKYDTQIKETIDLYEVKADHIIEQYDEMVVEAKKMLNPQTVVSMGEGIVISSLQSLGMSNLKELGEKGRVISNAKIGLQIVGNELAKGAGVNELLEKFAPQIEAIKAGAGIRDFAAGNPMLQFAMQLFGFGGGAPGGQVVSNVPAGAINITKELTK